MEIASEDVQKKAKTLLEQRKVKKEVETGKRIHFKVQGETEQHSVIFNKDKTEWVCDCRYFSLKRKECSHILASKMLL